METTISYNDQMAFSLRVSKPNVPLDTLVGFKEIKKEILKYLQKPAEGQDSFNDESYPDRILLYGATGTGKSHFVEDIATTINATLAEVTCCYPEWAYNMELFAKTLYNKCNKDECSTVVVFFDNLDFRCGNEKNTQTMIRLISSIQRIWKKIGGRNSSRLIIFATTNMPNLLDARLVCCFDRRNYCSIDRKVAGVFLLPLPNKDERCWIIIRYLVEKKYAHALNLEEISCIAQNTESYTGAELITLVQFAGRNQFKDCYGPDGEKKDPLPPLRDISFMDFRDVLRMYMRPVNSKKHIKELEAWNRKRASQQVVNTAGRSSSSLKECILCCFGSLTKL